MGYLNVLSWGKREHLFRGASQFATFATCDSVSSAGQRKGEEVVAGRWEGGEDSGETPNSKHEGDAR